MPELTKIIGHCKLKCAFTNLKVNSNKCVRVQWLSSIYIWVARENQATESTTRNEPQYWWKCLKQSKNAVFVGEGEVLKLKKNKVSRNFFHRIKCHRIKTFVQERPITATCMLKIPGYSRSNS